MSAATTTAPSNSGTRAPPRIGVAAAFALTAIGFPKLALPALVAMIIVTASLPAASDLARPSRNLVRALVALGFVAASVASVRFVLVDALSGIVEAGKRDSGNMAVSRLREILFGEDAARRHAYVDPDGDGIGSAMLLEELMATVPLRSGRPLPVPVLEFRNVVRVPSQPPALGIEGYLYRVCLPRRGGGWTASVGTPVDDELSERRFIAYAWPRSRELGLSAAFALDEHERILQYDEPGKPYSGPPGPPCDAILNDRAHWKAWKGKKPRTTLPGDSARQ